MKSIQVDDDVYKTLEISVSGFGDTPNLVLRRLLGLDKNGSSPINEKTQQATSKVQRKGKAPRTDIKTLISVGSLQEGQELFLHDYKEQRIPGIQANIRGNQLEFQGQFYSMSKLTKELMHQHGYDSEAFRGPKYWYTAEGKSVMSLWNEYLASNELKL
jgi:hypothetical protein